jgi:hypothetical protein
MLGIELLIVDRWSRRRMGKLYLDTIKEGKEEGKED